MVVAGPAVAAARTPAQDRPSLHTRAGQRVTGAGAVESELSHGAGGNLTGPAASGHSLAFPQSATRESPLPGSALPRPPEAESTWPRGTRTLAVARGGKQARQAVVFPTVGHRRHRVTGADTRGHGQQDSISAECPGPRTPQAQSSGLLPGAGRGGGDSHSVQGPSGGGVPKGQSGATMLEGAWAENLGPPWLGEAQTQPQVV